MSMASQQYASLANASYKDQFPRSDPYPIGGVSYKVLEHHNNPRTGYQGTVYQRVDTGEIIVAHRGTETEEGLGQLLKDGLVDGVMVASRLNAQAADAIALTQRALDYAERESRKPGGHAPEVTVTGHSLGGTLAQITAHHFGLRGETFNAYGAASLGYSIDKSGDSVLNHVMAGDTVSAASPHFGQVRVYASAGEIAALHNCGYANDGNRLDPRAPGLATGVLAGSHSMHHFLNEDGKGRPDRSILSDPAARQLAEVFDPMIGKFRSDIALGRSIATVVARGLHGNALDALGELHGPLPAGEPAARAERSAAAEAAVTQRLADYHEQRQQFFRDRLPPIDRDTRPPEQLRRPGTEDGPESIIRYRTPDYLKPASPDYMKQGSGGLEHERATPSSDTRLQGDHAQAFPTDHPRYPLYAALEDRLPGVAKEKVAEITHQALVGGVTDPAQVRAVVVHEDQVWVAGRIPGYRANVSLSEPAPSFQESLRGIESSDSLQMQQMTRLQEQQRSASQGQALT